jgi:hypothetical protein
MAMARVRCDDDETDRKVGRARKQWKALGLRDGLLEHHVNLVEFRLDANGRGD